MDMLGTRFYCDLYIHNSIDSEQSLSHGFYLSNIQEVWDWFYGTGKHLAWFAPVGMAPNATSATLQSPSRARDFTP